MLKGRSYSNPIHVAVHSIRAADTFAEVTKTAELLAKRYLPGALTLVLCKRHGIPPLLVAGKDTVGIRIPKNKTILALAEMTELPITATSANPSGKPTPYSVQEVINQMGEAIEGVKLILDQGPLPSRGLSTIVDMTTDPPQLIRQGVISWLEIRQFLESIKTSG
jgi:L-threonylcarbamoyladenylate synthase